jgi:hypothetical protein
MPDCKALVLTADIAVLQPSPYPADMSIAIGVRLHFGGYEAPDVCLLARVDPAGSEPNLGIQPAVIHQTDVTLELVATQCNELPPAVSDRTSPTEFGSQFP